MKRLLLCLPLCFGLVAAPALSTPNVPAHGGAGCGAGEPAADISLMDRHAALKSAAEAAIAGQAQATCRDDGKPAPDRHAADASHAGHRHHRAGHHRHGSGGMCAATTPIALPELMQAHHGRATPRAPFAELAESAPALPLHQGKAHC